MTPDGVLTPLQAGAFTMVALIDGNEWDVSYSAYDWEQFTSSGIGFLSLESDARVSNRFGTLGYTEVVMACGPTSRFDLWVRVPHMITQNGLVGFTLDNGSMINQFWNELAPNYNTLWAPGSSATVKTFAQLVATARRFAFAFTEYNSVARAMAFRVTGMSSRLSSLLAFCPVSLKQSVQSETAGNPIDSRTVLSRILAQRSQHKDTTGADDLSSRREAGTASAASPLLLQWPTWQTPESTTARRVRR
jgi:hypothetical protein